MVFKTINTDDKDLQFIQDNVAASILPLESQPMVGGVVLKNISLVAGQDNIIQHTLGRFPQIFFVGNLNQNSVVWSQSSTALFNQSSNALNINLRCSVSCIITLWIN